ncbi:MAG: peroxidase [Myxococcales bacterium]|nr:peroxidase [Myxococcales bacterium]
MTSQPAILLPPLAVGQVLTLRLTSATQAKPLLRVFAALPIDESVVVGFGWHFVQAVGGDVPGLRGFPAMTLPESAGGAAVPATQADVWVYVRAGDAGSALERVLALMRSLPGGLGIVEDVATFTDPGGPDLSGDEDGTENPHGSSAAAAMLIGEGALAGGSFVAAQRWVHESGALSAPEPFEPPAFMRRRSMPYGGAREQGRYLVAYGADLDRFERVMRQMAGQDDGVVDALFRLSRPATGGYYWCPALQDGKLDLVPMVGAGGVEAMPDVAV